MVSGAYILEMLVFIRWIKKKEENLPFFDLLPQVKTQYFGTGVLET